ncbi:MAG: NEW3 domain-containing protein, partial [Candidatus Promineifilaceae bacterium]
EIAAGGSAEVTATITPSEQALAGDYVVTFRATPEGGAAASAEFRITARTSTLWGVVGIGLIAVAVAVVGMAVSRFGRR